MSSSDNIPEPVKFGERLYKTRKAQKLSVDEISELLKVPPQIILAIEQSDVKQLPAPTFTRGYLRAYARCLEIKDVDILAEYGQVTPQHVPLKPRSNLRNHHSSQSPLFKTVTFILIILGILAVIFGGYQYYDKKSTQLKASSQTLVEEHASEVSSLDAPRLILIPGRLVPAKQNESLAKQPAPGTEKQAGSTSLNSPATVVIDKNSVSKQHKNLPQDKTAGKPADKSIKKTTSVKQVIRQPADTIELLAKNGAWVKITDATGRRLHYNMIPKGKWVSYQGKAPFKVSLGNARSTSIRVNRLNVDISKYTKPNNTAQFNVSTIDSNGHQTVLFH